MHWRYKQGRMRNFHHSHVFPMVYHEGAENRIKNRMGWGTIHKVHGWSSRVLYD